MVNGLLKITNKYYTQTEHFPNDVYSSIFTACIRSVWKVMFSVLFVRQSVQLRDGGSHVNFAHDALGHSIVVYKSIMG